MSVSLHAGDCRAQARISHGAIHFRGGPNSRRRFANRWVAPTLAPTYKPPLLVTTKSRMVGIQPTERGGLLPANEKRPLAVWPRKKHVGFHSGAFEVVHSETTPFPLIGLGI